MQSRTKWLLAAMMFLQYAVWGAWTPILGATLTSRMHAKGTEIGMIYGVLWLACIITPFIGGQLVDRLMSSQVYLGLAAIVCTVSAAMMSQQQTIGGLANWMWVWSLAFAPTLGIANAIVFYHLGKERTSATQQERDFLRNPHGGNCWLDCGWDSADGLFESAYKSAERQMGAF